MALYNIYISIYTNIYNIYVYIYIYIHVYRGLLMHFPYSDFKYCHLLFFPHFQTQLTRFSEQFLGLKEIVQRWILEWMNSASV